MQAVPHRQYINLAIYAKPRAKRTALVAVNGQELQITLHANPTEGAANTALIAYVAELLGLAKRQVRLLRGEKSRHKHIQVPLTATVQAFLQDPQKFIIA